MIVLGVDPGKVRCGWALIGAGCWLQSGVMEGHDFDHMQDLVSDYGAELVVIERPFFPKRKTRHTATISSIVDVLRCFHGWEVVCSLAGVPVIQVAPNTWQADLGVAAARTASGKKSKTSFVREATAIKGSRAYADEADAILIAAWGAQQHSKEARHKPRHGESVDWPKTGSLLKECHKKEIRK